MNLLCRNVGLAGVSVGLALSYWSGVNYLIVFNRAYGASRPGQRDSLS